VSSIRSVVKYTLLQANKHGPVAHCEGVDGAAAGDGGVRRRLPGEHAHLSQEHRVCQQQHLLHPCGQHRHLLPTGAAIKIVNKYRYGTRMALNVINNNMATFPLSSQTKCLPGPS
jgi:hypothetical protein